MSYDISWKVKVQDTDLFVSLPYPDCANITWNVGKMIRVATGLDWDNEEDNGLVTDVMPHIYDGYKELCTHPEKYKQYESPNGWGTVDGCRRFFKKLIDNYEMAQDDSYMCKLLPYAHFWII